MTQQMGNSNAQIEVDYSVLERALQVLEGSGFNVAESSLTDHKIPWLLAENDLFAIGVVATRSLQDLLALESHASEYLAKQIQNAGPKRWDTYLVLIASEDSEARGLKEVRSIQYDTHSLRRLVGLGVNSAEESVRRVLGIFLPLPAPTSEGFGSAASSLIDELYLLGIEQSRAGEAVHHYQSLTSAQA